MEKKRKTYEMDMCSGPVLGKMLRFALPLMCSSILQLLFNAADIVVVGRYAGDNSLAAVGSNTSLINLLINLFVGLSIGANILAARNYGSKSMEDLSETVHTSMLLALLSGIGLAVVGAVGARGILVAMQTPAEVLDLAALYLRIYFLGMPATMLYNFGSALLRAVGDTQRPLRYLLLAGVINVGLNLLFVIQFKMDVAGVALATVISQFISAALVVRCLVRDQGAIHLDLRGLRIHKSKLQQILQIGLPAGFQGLVFSISNVVIQSTVNSFGPIVMAGNSAASNIEQFVYFGMNAFYQATISFTSQNLGAGKYSRIKYILFNGLGAAFVIGMVLSLLAVTFGRTLLGIYSPSAPIIEAGMVRLKIVCATYAVCGLMDVMVGALRGIGHSVLPMIVSMVGACGLRLLWIAVVFQMPAYHTIEMVYYSYPLSWFVTLLAHVGCFIYAYRHMGQRFGVAEKKA